MLSDLTDIQVNVLLASIIGDGEITKIYKGSRRKNNSYREHYGKSQEEYRKWKIGFLPEHLYLTPNSQTVRSASQPLFTNLYTLFYKDNCKQIPSDFLHLCTYPHFLAILYMDDGSLSISHRVNHRNKKIYLLPHIYLYLQCYEKNQLVILQKHIQYTFDINLKLSSRKDGSGFILKTTTIAETMKFLNTINPITKSCPTMYYKTEWSFRLEYEISKWKNRYCDYEVIVSSSDRYKNYSEEEISTLVKLKRQGVTDREIALHHGRTYWSVLYKLSD
ncbi:DNA endonuclease [Bacillus haimaensis]|uniref:DNA endonuclease n=1 Tax=Bacillus haimaensis TaxID=3160967 RepID=UPI003AA8AF66